MSKKIKFILSGASIIIVATGLALFFILIDSPDVNSFSECALRYPVMESYPRKCSSPDGKSFTEEITENKPLPPDDTPLIMSPRTLEIIYGSSIEVTGFAPGTWFFEAVFPILLIDPSGKELVSSHVEAKGEWMTAEMVEFSGSLNVPLDFSGPAMVIIRKDNPSGLPENDNEVRIPVVIQKKSEETSSVIIYFGKYGPSSSMDSCTETFGVTRTIPKTHMIGRSAIEELLKGPSETDKSAGYFTSINAGVSLISLSVKDGTAYAEFDENLERAVGGSCRVAAIRAQITDTLKQFPTVQNVVISINGRTEDILQP